MGAFRSYCDSHFSLWLDMLDMHVVAAGLADKNNFQQAWFRWILRHESSPNGLCINRLVFVTLSIVVSKRTNNWCLSLCRVLVWSAQHWTLYSQPWDGVKWAFCSIKTAFFVRLKRQHLRVTVYTVCECHVGLCDFLQVHNVQALSEWHVLYC